MLASIPGIEAPSDTSLSRVVLYQGGRLVHSAATGIFGGLLQFVTPQMFRKKGDTDWTNAIQRAVTFLGDKGGGVIRFPAGRYTINGGASDTPVEVDEDNITLDLDPGAVLVKNVADRQLIVVGANATDGNRVKRFRMFGGHLECNAQDTSNNFSSIHLLYAEDWIVDGLTGENVGVAVRGGRGSASFTDRRAKGGRVQNCRFTNPKYNCIEFFGVEGGFVHNNEIIGGANSGSIECRAIRVVASTGVVVSANRTEATGCGIHINTDTASGANEDISVIGNICSGHTHLGAFKVDFDVNRLTVVGNQFIGGGGNYAGPLCLIDGRSGDEGTDLLWADNLLIGDGTESDLCRINFQNRGTIAGGRAQHRGGALASSHYGYRLVSCDGLWRVGGVVIEGDDADFRPLYDASGAATLTIHVSGNTLSRPGLAASPSSAVMQDGLSAGTIYLGGAAGDDNLYLG